MRVVGIDLGSVAAKGVLLDGRRIYTALRPTGWSPREAGEEILAVLLQQAGLHASQVDKTVATGYGRVTYNGADRTITEISCHARGVFHLYPQARTIIDIGGQDSKVISINHEGKVADFAMNDRCAAGTGRFLQVMANALGLEVSQLGEKEKPGEQVTVSSMCTVFAESEVIGLLAAGTSIGGIIAGVHQAVGKRVAAMAKKLGLVEKIIFTGGVAMNKGVHRALCEELGYPVLAAQECQFTGALGAALLAL